MTLTKISLKVNGVPLQDTDLDALVELSVDTDAFLPAMFSFTLEDPSLQYINSGKFPMGAAVDISFKTEQEIEIGLIKGEITSIEPVFASGLIAMLSIRGYDRSHRLTRDKKTRVFSNMTDSDIVSKIAGDNSLSPVTDSTSGTHEYLLQYNQTDWEFIWERARKIGYQVYVKDRNLYFQKANKQRESQTLELEWGKDLTSFEPRATLMGQVSSASAHGWDPKKKDVISSEVSSSTVSLAPSIADSKGGAALQKAFGKASEVFTDQPVMAVGEAKTLADAELSARESDYVRANGFCEVGDARLLAGSKVNIKGVGSKFSGTYYVTKALHVWRGGLYTVNFSVSGSGPNTVYNLLQNDAHHENNKIYGMVTALITNINDPDKLGRVKVKFPWDPQLESNWIRLAVPAAGNGRGIFFTPEINDEVLVAFEHGDPNFPYIVGVLWNGKDKPPEGTAQIFGSDKKVNQRVIRSRSGHLIILDDTQNQEQIIIQDSTGKDSIVMSTKDKTITMKSDGDFSIEAGGKFTIKSKGDIVMETKANSDIKSEGSFKAEAKQEAVMEVPASKVSVKTSGSELSGNKLDVKANTMVSINGNAMVEVKGGIVKIN